MINDFLDALSDDEFEEFPVDLTTFVQDPDYMGLPPLSDEQYAYVENASNIYKPETIRKVWDKETADRLIKANVKEILLMIGKGGGKNHSTIVTLARIVYLLLCLKDPASYYGKPPGDAIDVLNVAVNAKQANNTFFNPFKKRIQMTPWFDGKYTATRNGEINFNKNITCYSGHSEREAWEGYNFIFVVLDEIAAFATEAEVSNSSNADRANSAAALYKMYKASVTSRFPDVGKVALLSWPRFKGDFISTRYNEVVRDKVVNKYSATFKLHEDVADSTPGNEFEIEWEEEVVTAVSEPHVYVKRLPSWRFNPAREVHEYKMDFWRDPVDSLSRYACNPPDSIDAFFKDRERVERAFRKVRTPFNDDWSFHPSFEPEAETNYYVHVDLAERSDRAAVAMAHVSDWTTTGKGTAYESIAPVVFIDAVRWWTPKSDQNVEFGDVREYILSLRRRGFNLQVVTFDRWAGSIGMQNELAQLGIDVETLSVQKNEYNDLSLLINENRLDGYQVADERGQHLLVDELLGLKIRPGGKVDHTRQGSNDLADAVAGAAYLASKHEIYSGTPIIEIEYGDNVIDRHNEQTRVPVNQGIISRPPKRPMPDDVADYLENMSVI